VVKILFGNRNASIAGLEEIMDKKYLHTARRVKKIPVIFEICL